MPSLILPETLDSNSSTSRVLAVVELVLGADGYGVVKTFHLAEPIEAASIDVADAASTVLSFPFD